MTFWRDVKACYLRRWTTSHDKMCTKRMARPTLSRITMQIMMVFGPLKRREHVTHKVSALFVSSWFGCNDMVIMEKNSVMCLQ